MISSLCALTVALTVASSATPWPPLVDAARRHDVARVTTLLDQRVDVNEAGGDGATALHWAVYHDDLPLVARLLEAGADVNAANDLAITPLHLASMAGRSAIVRALLARGAHPRVRSETGVTPLMEAARSGAVDAVRALLEAGADLDAREHDRQQTALMWAVSRRHAAVVQLLLEHGADVRARSKSRPLQVMLDQGPRRVVKTSQQDARRFDAGGNTALLFAAQVGDAASARLLLAAGADVNDRSADGRTALVLATFAGHSDVARLLLDAGANPDDDRAGYTALHAAVLRGDAATVRALLEKGAAVDRPLTKGSPVRRFGSQWALPATLTGATSLLVAATYLEVDIMKALLAAGAAHSLGLADGTTPLLAAAGIAVGTEARPSDLARWNIVDNDTPQVPRAEAEVLDAVTLLLDAGADVNQTNAAGDTALHAAAASGLLRVMERLAERGAALDVENASGLTPLALTMPRGREEGNQPAEALMRRLLGR